MTAPDQLGPAVEDRGAATRQLLVVSMVAAGVLGGLGVVWGVLVGSQMILLDGIYSFVGIVLSALLLWASALAEREPSRRFQFGLEAATPLAIAIQAVVLLATLLYAVVEAVATIRAGGSDVAAGWAIAYGVVTAIACLAVAIALQRRAAHSDVLVAEAAAWRVAAYRGAGMIVGFAILALLDGSSWSEAAPYVDPVMVLVTCVALLPTPLRLLGGTIVELLEGAPPATTADKVEAALHDLEVEFDLDELGVHVAKLGPKLYVEVSTTAAPTVTIRQEHEVRESLRRRLAALPYEVWLNLELLPRPSHSEVGPLAPGEEGC